MPSPGDYADFDVDEWHRLTEANKGGKLVFSVYIKRGGEWKQYRDFTVNVSSDPLGEWGLTYRLISPGYEVYGKMGLYQRNLSNFDEQAILVNTAVPGACLNCHTSNQTSPEQFTFHIRGANGGTLISQHGRMEILKAKNDSLKGSMVYPYWHPSGQWVAYSTNQTHQSFHAVRSERIEVFDQASDVLIYHPATHRIVLNPAVMTKDHYENYPVFSPDGRTLYFVSSTAWDIPAHYKDIKYNICRVGFDPKTGHTVGKVDTIFNARLMGKSANHPRPSYDGRFLLFTLSDYGCFPIWHTTAIGSSSPHDASTATIPSSIWLMSTAADAWASLSCCLSAIPGSTTTVSSTATTRPTSPSAPSVSTPVRLPTASAASSAWRRKSSKKRQRGC